MRSSTVALVVALVVTGIAFPANAFSPIGNVNGWSRDRLAAAGIVVSPWRHEREGEDPPLQWVQVSFDCAAAPKEHDVVMTAWIRSAGGETLSASRAGRANAVDGRVVLTFCLTPAQIESPSAVVIKIWSKTPKGAEASGYELSLKRIAELARERAVGARPARK